ncbi:Thioesterase superfamily [Popillia japonica]|uniref:Acyl-coenzyme A thioesterase 13 n=1 Tax=Popillia japonica TaxID=7064 RepID=A0AAW1HRQ1_POPJA
MLKFTSAEKAIQLLFTSKGFDNVLHAVKIITSGNGSVTAELKVDEEHLNLVGMMHGGFSATLVDVVSGIGLLTHKVGLRPSVSINMNLDYLSSAKVGDTIQIISDTLKAGNNLAFLQIEIKNKETGVILVKGTHTKFLLGK